MRSWRTWCDEAAEGEPAGLATADLRGVVTPHEVSPLVAGLSPGLVALREFPLRKWYYADRRWYYHAPALEHRLRDDPRFYRLVDPPLRELCRLVRAAGLATTPSCSGHFYLKARFQQIWGRLNQDASAIRGAGLVVLDSETDVPHRFRDPGYEVPWTGFEQFYEAAGAMQTQGYIGIVFPPGRAEVEQIVAEAFTTDAARVRLDEELSAVLGQPLVGVHVRAASPEERDAVWGEVTAYFEGVLGGRAVG